MIFAYILSFFRQTVFCCFYFPLDSLARSPETPPAHRPHWPSQSPQNPVGNLSHFCANKDLTQRGKNPHCKQSTFGTLLSHPNVIVTVENSIGNTVQKYFGTFFSHPNIIVTVENLGRQNISLPFLFLATISHVGSVILIIIEYINILIGNVKKCIICNHMRSTCRFGDSDLTMFKNISFVIFYEI